MNIWMNAIQTYSHQRSKDGSKVRHWELNSFEVHFSSKEGAAAGLAFREWRAEGVSQVLDGFANVIGAEINWIRQTLIYSQYFRLFLSSSYSEQYWFLTKSRGHPDTGHPKGRVPASWAWAWSSGQLASLGCRSSACSGRQCQAGRWRLEWIRRWTGTPGSQS